MVQASPRTPIFARGTTVLDYWLAHAEGLVLRPTGARVEEVVARPPAGRVESLIVRSRMTRRRKTIPAAAIAAVDPGAGTLHLEPEPPAARRFANVPAAAGRAGAAAARATLTGSRSTVAWLRPRAAHAGRTAGRATWTGTRSTAAWVRPRAARAGAAGAAFGRRAAARVVVAVAWLVPRLTAITRLVAAKTERAGLACAVALARGGARAAAALESATEAAAERCRAALEARRARAHATARDQPPDDTGFHLPDARS